MKNNKKKYKITVFDMLKAYKKANRENTERIKPMVTTDKKKKENKEYCKNWKEENEND